MSADEFEKSDDHPIIQYSNRLQKLLAICTSILYDGVSGCSEKVKWLRSVIVNLPPSGKETLDGDWKKLVNYQSDVHVFGDVMELEHIYSRIHNWIYSNVLQDAFRAVPLYRKAGTLKEGVRESDKAKGLGEPSSA